MDSSDLVHQLPLQSWQRALGTQWLGGWEDRTTDLDVEEKRQRCLDVLRIELRLCGSPVWSSNCTQGIPGHFQLRLFRYFRINRIYSLLFKPSNGVAIVEAEAVVVVAVVVVIVMLVAE
jgi:hypothetical protein